VDKEYIPQISTPIQDFYNCIWFSFDIPEAIDDEFYYIFAPNIGPVRYTNSMNPYELYKAEINGEIITNIDLNKSCPSLFKLEQNYPNPFNSATKIKFYLPLSAHVKIKIFNINGQYLDTILDDYLLADNYAITWSPANLPSGNYIINVTTGNFQKNIKCTYLK